MTTPYDRKSLKVSPDVHQAVFDLSTELALTVDETIRHLIGLSTVRVHVTPRQRERWSEAAAAAGMPLEHFIEHQVESCLLWGTDLNALGNMIRDIHGQAVSPVMGETIRQTFYRVDALAKVAGLAPPAPRAPVVPPGKKR